LEPELAVNGLLPNPCSDLVGPTLLRLGGADRAPQLVLDACVFVLNSTFLQGLVQRQYTAVVITSDVVDFSSNTVPSAAAAVRPA
jgi:hypothetical protein